VLRRRRHWAAMVPALSASPPPGPVRALSLATLGVAQGALSLQRACHARAAHERSAPEVLPRASAAVARFPGPPAFRFSLRRLVHPACGALFRRGRLTFQGSRDDCSLEAESVWPDSDLFRRFRAQLIERTQINGSFYARGIDGPGAAALASVVGGLQAPDTHRAVAPNRGCRSP